MTLYANATVANNGCLSPANAHGAPDGTWTTNDGDSEDWDCRWGMENPSGDLADTQDIQVTVRKNETGGNGDPTVTVELWESGTLISTLQGSTAISSTTGVQVGGTFDASVLSDISGAGIQVRVISVGVGGMPAGRRSIQVDGITYEEQLDAFPALAPTLLTPADESVVTDPTFTWEFNTDNTGETQAAFAFRRTYDAVDEWWDGSAWVGTETWIESATESVTIPVEEFLPANEAVQWTVSTRETTNGGESPYATPWTVTISFLTAPTLVAPADGADHDGQDFSWQFNPQALGGTQTEFAFRRVELTRYQSLNTMYDGLGLDSERVTWTSDASLIALVYKETFLVYENTTLNLVHNQSISNMRYGQFSNDDTLFAIARNADTQRLRVFNTSDWSEVSVHTEDASPMTITFSPDDSLMVYGLLSTESSLKVINTLDWTVLSGTPVFSDSVWDTAFSNDGSLLAVGYNSTPFLKVFNTSDWSEVPNTPTLHGPVQGINFSPDDSLLATGISDSSGELPLIVYETATWNIAYSHSLASSGNRTGLTAVFSVDGKHLISGISFLDTQPSIVVLDVQTWTEVPVVDNGTTSSIRYLDVSSNHEIGLPVDRHPVHILESKLDELWWSGTEWVETETYITSADEQVSLPLGAWLDE